MIPFGRVFVTICFRNHREVSREDDASCHMFWRSNQFNKTTPLTPGPYKAPNLKVIENVWSCDSSRATGSERNINCTCPEKKKLLTHIIGSRWCLFTASFRGYRCYLSISINYLFIYLSTCIKNTFWLFIHLSF